MFDLIPINRRVNRLARSAFDDMSDFMSDFSTASLITLLILLPATL